MISIVSPVYNAAAIIPELLNRIDQVCLSNAIDYEVILIDDCSKDQSWEVIMDQANHYNNLRAYKMSRNFGQHYAITAGISKAKGDSIIIMDCDLQDNPEYIPLLLKKKQEGFNIVCTIKNVKKHAWYRKFASDTFFFIINHLSDVKLEKNLGTFTLIDKTVANRFLEISDYHRHTSLIFAWLGFKRGYVYVEHQPRFEGKSSYNFAKLVSHAINGVISQSDKILKWSISIGLFIFVLSIIGVLAIIVKSFYTDFDTGWPSLFVAILFSTGIILSMIGILGLYLGKIFEQVKQRPLFIISEAVNGTQNELD